MTRALAAPKEPALLLRRFAYGESSLVLHLLTPGAGKVALLAKGAYRPSSAFYAVFDLFDTLEVGWNRRTGQELGLVARADIRTRRSELAQDLERYRVAVARLELAQLTAREGHEERALFAWLESALDLLQRGRARPMLVGVASDLALLRQNGLAPALLDCASCGGRGEERGNEVAFSDALGGRLCAACAQRERARSGPVESLALNLVRVADSLLAATPPMLERMQIDAGLLERLRLRVQRFLEYHLESRLRSRGPALARPFSR